MFFNGLSVSLIGVEGISGSQIAIVAVLGALGALMLIRTQRRLADGGPSPRAYAREQMGRLREERVVHDQMVEVAAEVQQVAREMSAQLDGKFIKLEKTLRDADERIQTLEAMIRRAEGKPKVDLTVSDESKPTLRTFTKADREANRARIFELADAGGSRAHIAAKLHVPAAEVDLVLSVRRMKEQAAATANS